MKRERATSAWRCPDCKRTFGRAKQSHTCVPTMAYFADRNANDRRIDDAVARYVKKLGDVTIDIVS